MKKTDADSLADIIFSLHWEKQGISHSDTYFAGHVNFWRDVFPERIFQAISNRPEGFSTELSFEPGELIPDHSEKQVHQVKHHQFDLNRIPGSVIHLREGLYYPKGIIKGMAGIYRESISPFRCTSIQESEVTADFNHPLAGTPVRLVMEIGRIYEKEKERGGSSTDWIETVTSGPGMQARFQNRKSDFFSGDSFLRDDKRPDKVFYDKERLVSHIDDHANQTLSEKYGEVLRDGDTVLDLMGSLDSHLPEGLHLNRLHGLGLNEKELAANKRLSGFTIQDLNETTELPFPDNTFDAVICSLSVEYLIRPFELFRETARVLKPGGAFMVTFSNRWFPPKAIHIWTEIHEFERMGLVTEYFLESGLFEKIDTFSQRGYPRPVTDHYSREILHADPVYMVKGFRCRD